MAKKKHRNKTAKTAEPQRYENVYVDLPDVNKLGADCSWRSVANFHTVPEAISWIRENVGNCDDDGNICLLTLGEPQDAAESEPPALSAAEQHLLSLVEKLEAKGHTVVARQVLTNVMDRAEICVQGVQLDPRDVADFSSWGLRLLAPTRIRKENCWCLQFAGPDLSRDVYGTGVCPSGG